MRASHRRILFTALASELAVTLVPQWTRLEFVAAGPGGTVHPVMQSAGFHFLFAPPTAGLSQAIDFGRLGLTWLLVAQLAALAWLWTLRPSSGPASSDEPEDRSRRRGE